MTELRRQQLREANMRYRQRHKHDPVYRIRRRLHDIRSRARNPEHYRRYHREWERLQRASQLLDLDLLKSVSSESCVSLPEDYQ